MYVPGPERQPDVPGCHTSWNCHLSGQQTYTSLQVVRPQFWKQKSQTILYRDLMYNYKHVESMKLWDCNLVSLCERNGYINNQLPLYRYAPRQYE